MINVLRNATFIPNWTLFMMLTAIMMIAVWVMRTAEHSKSEVATNVTCTIKNKSFTNERINLLADCDGHDAWINAPQMVYDLVKHSTTTFHCDVIFHDGSVKDCNYPSMTD